MDSEPVEYPLLLYVCKHEEVEEIIKHQPPNLVGFGHAMNNSDRLVLQEVLRVWNMSIVEMMECIAKHILLCCLKEVRWVHSHGYKFGKMAAPHLETLYWQTETRLSFFIHEDPEDYEGRYIIYRILPHFPRKHMLKRFPVFMRETRKIYSTAGPYLSLIHI